MVEFSARARRDGVRSVLALALAAASGVSLAPQAWAQSGSATAEARAIDFDIPAQPLSAALLALADQSGLQVLFAEDDLAGLVSRPVRGHFTPEAALAHMLPAGAPPIVIAGAQIVRAEPHAGDAGATPNDDIVVTGTRIRGAAPAGANLMTLDRGDVEATGRSTIQDVLATLPQNFPGAQGEATQLGASDSRRNISFGSTVDLRGLGADATLTLVNGHRLAPAGYGNFVDVSAIPVSAVRRIDILADGASAIYGADAVGGVVNVILRNDFDGAETALRYGGATQGGAEDVGASALWGRAWTGGGLMAAYEYRHRGALAAADRWFTSNSDLRPWGGVNFSSTSSNPGNIIRVGATSVVYAIPEGQDGTSLSQADLIVGVRNYQNTTEGNSLLPDQQSHSLFAAAHQSFGDLTLSAEVLASVRDAFAYRFQNNANLTVPQSNYYRTLNNLFPGQGNLVIAYNLGADLGPTWLDTEASALNTVLSAAYDLPGAWRVEGMAGYARHEDDSVNGNVYDSGSLNAALASSNIATAFNPFADGSNSAPGVLEGLTYRSLISAETNITSFGVKADGPLFRLWGGDVRLALGGERRREQFDFETAQRRASGDTVSHPFAPGDRTTDAVFAELFAPLIGPDQGLPLLREVSLSLSLRHEAPSDFEATTVPKIGVHWGLSEGLALRATWGQSFKAPQFQQMLGSVGGTISVATPAQDPFATNGSTGVLLLSGSNPDLRPEEAETWTAGFDFTPPWLAGFSLHATYFDIDFANRIGNAGSVLAALANPTGYESVFIRNPSAQQISTYLGYADTVVGVVPPDGIEAIWDGRLTNLATLRVRGVDVNGSYGRQTPFGALQVFANASLLLQDERRTTPAAHPLDVLDTIFNPIGFRARAGVSLNTPHWQAMTAVNYVDDYRDTISVPNRDINESVTWDARLAYVHRGDDASGFQIALNVQNLFDADPPFANNPIGYGYDTQNANPIGRFVSLELRRSW